MTAAFAESWARLSIVPVTAISIGLATACAVSPPSNEANVLPRSLRSPR